MSIAKYRNVNILFKINDTCTNLYHIDSENTRFKGT